MASIVALLPYMPELSCFLNAFMLPGLCFHNCVFCSVKLPNCIGPMPIPTYTVVCTDYCAQEHTLWYSAL